MKLLDLILAAMAFVAAFVLKPMRAYGLRKLPMVRKALLSAGVIPIRDHYYDPKILHENYDPDRVRDLPGIDLNVSGQLEFLGKLTYASEIDFPSTGKGTSSFHFGPENDQFRQGDAEVLYQVVRHLKPRKIVEIGSGWSTKIAVKARDMNLFELGSIDKDYTCSHICIEPYEDRGLESMGIELLRKRVEDMDLSLFESLEPNDILFIDSTHIIRPGGDVLTEYLSIIPRLKPGVVVHVHDIFTPYDYPKKWVVEDLRFWNEQYILEALLSGGKLEVLLANYYLSQNRFHRLKKVAPYLTLKNKPGSFYMRVK